MSTTKERVTIRKATDLGKFQANKSQRSINNTHVKKIAGSIEKNGFMGAFPIAVEKNGTGFTVIDGHHRLEAARAVDSFVYYVVTSDIDILEINSCQKAWSGYDTLMHYVRKGEPDYVTLYRWMSEYKLTLAEAFDINRLRGGSTQKRFKLGIIKLLSESRHLKISGLRDEICALAATNPRGCMIRVLSQVVDVKGLDMDRLLRGVKSHPAPIRVARDQGLFLRALEECYNYRFKDKKPLEFMVHEHARKAQEKNLKRLNS